MTARRIDQFFSAPSARNDRWREVHAAAKAWARGRGDRAAVEAALDEGAAIEELHAYPGARLLGALRDRLEKDDATGVATLAQRISASIAARGYKEDAADWDTAESAADE